MSVRAEGSVPSVPPTPLHRALPWGQLYHQCHLVAGEEPLWVTVKKSIWKGQVTQERRIGLEWMFTRIPCPVLEPGVCG